MEISLVFHRVLTPSKANTRFCASGTAGQWLAERLRERSKPLLSLYSVTFPPAGRSVRRPKPQRAVTKLPVTKSNGRPPIGEKAMTGAECMRKLRATRRARSTGRTEHLPEDERCPDCGTLLILVGRFHLCRPRQAVTKFPVTKSGGRRSIGEKAMTGAGRMRKLRATRRTLTRTV